MSSAGCDPLPANNRKATRSTLVSRNMTIAGHRTSVRLEPEMWSGLAEISRRERASLHEIGTSVATRKQESTSMTAAIRVFVMAYFRNAATEDGHVKAGHGYGAVTAIAPTVTSVGMAPPPVQPTSMARPLNGSPAPFSMNGRIDSSGRRF